MNNRGGSIIKLVIIIATLGVIGALVFIGISNTSKHEAMSEPKNMGEVSTDQDVLAFSLEMTSEEKQELTEWLSGMSAEEFNAAVGAAMDNLDEDGKAEFLEWLKENHLVSGGCDSADWPLTVEFEMPKGFTWPQGVPQPEQGRVASNNQGGNTQRIEIDGITKSTCEAWANSMMENGWAENAGELEQMIRDALAADLGTSASDAEKYFSESGISVSETRYFLSQDELQALEFAFGANTALLTVTQNSKSEKSDEAKIMEASWKSACIAPIPAPGGGRLKSYNKDAKTPGGQDGQILVADELTPELTGEWLNAVEDAGWTRLDEAPSVFSSSMAYTDGSTAKSALDYMAEHGEVSTADIEFTYYTTIGDDGTTYVIEVLTHGSFVAVTINAG